MIVVEYIDNLESGKRADLLKELRALYSTLSKCEALLLSLLFLMKILLLCIVDLFLPTFQPLSLWYMVQKESILILRSGLKVWLVDCQHRQYLGACSMQSLSAGPRLSTF